MITLLVHIALVGLAAWAIAFLVPMAPKFKTLIYVAASVWCLLFVLGHFGLYHGTVPGLDLLLVMAIVGVTAWALTSFFPMPEKLQTAIYVLACLLVLFYCLSYFGLWHGLPKGLR